MQLTEGVKASQRLINEALSDPNLTLGFEAEFYLLGAQKAVEEHMTAGTKEVDTGDGVFHAKRLGQTTYDDALHFWVPLGVDSSSLKDNSEILQDRIVAAYEQETGGDGTLSSVRDIWSALTEQYRIHQLMAVLRSYPKDRIIGIPDNKLQALEDIVYDGDLEEITPFGKLNDVMFAIAEVGFEPDDFGLPVNKATQDTLYALVAKDLSGKVNGQVVSSSDEERTHHISGGYQSWTVTYDSSLEKIQTKADVFGVETVSPIFQAADGLDQLMSFLQIMQGEIIGLDVVTTMETGLHINIGVKGKEIDALKMLVLLGDQHTLEKFGREMSDYSAPTLRELQKRIQAAGQGQTVSSKTPDVKTSRELVALTQDLLRKVKVDQSDIQRLTTLLDQVKPEGKSFSVNFSTLPSGYVEFRALGNAGYENRAQDIRDAVLRMLVITYIATDPEAYRQEFLKRLYQVVVRALQDVPKQPLAASQGAYMVGRGPRGGYGSEAEEHPLTQFDGEAYMHQTGFDSGSNTQ